MHRTLAPTLLHNHINSLAVQFAFTVVADNEAWVQKEVSERDGVEKEERGGLSFSSGSEPEDLIVPQVGRVGVDPYPARVCLFTLFGHFDNVWIVQFHREML